MIGRGIYDLSGQTALVTGGAQGIGFGIACELARTGCRVIIADRNLDGAKAAVQKIEALGQEALALSLDVTDDSSVRQCIESAIAWRGVEILVNNAGIHTERIGQLSTIENFHRCLEVNLLGGWRVIQALAPHFRAHRRGKIVNIASINGRKPWVDTPAYSASKAAFINLTQSLAATLGADGINVNAVCPGGVITAMADPFKVDRPDILSGILSSRTLQRELAPEDIGMAVVFLVSQQARCITGQALNVDCGQVMS